jgi:hypothetical protein
MDMAEKLKQIQQGDVLLQEIKSLPEGAKQTPGEGRIVVSRGEHGGHSHIIDSDRAKLWKLTRDGITELYLEVQVPVTLVHDEHKPLPIPVGIYRVGRVKEYDYFAEMERKVID